MFGKIAPVLLALASAGCFANAAAAAEAPSDYPGKQPVRIIVPYPAGGSTDLLARVLGQKVGEQIGQTVVVENRPGASGNIGASYVAKSPADGYTLFLGTSTALAVNPSLYKTLPYSPDKDFSPIILATLLPSLVVVGNSVPVKTMKELPAYLKSNASQVAYASSGNGTPAHLGGELYKKTVGLPTLSHVPYKGGVPALTDLVGGQTTVMFAILPEAYPLVKEGKLRALAVTTASRLPQLPNLPTVAESGAPGYELVGWYGFLAPAGTPAPIIAKLNHAFDHALKDEEVKAKLVGMGFEMAGGPPEVLASKMRSETAKWRKVINDSHITLD